MARCPEKMKMKTKKKTQANGHNQVKPLAVRYTCCVAGYYVPGLDEDEIVRMTAAVVDLDTDKLVEHREFWAEDDDMDLAVEDAVELAEQYGARIHFVSRPVPLEKCPCGCKGYSVRTVTRRDVGAMARG